MGHKTKKGLLILLFVLPWSASYADSPKWTMEFAGGLIYPKDPNMQHYYGKMPELSFSLARRFMGMVDLGATISYAKDVGSGYLASSGAKTGEVVFKQLPVDVYAVFRARFSENQWIVPYVGGGYTRLFYQQYIVDQEKIQGSVGGEHVRAGLQFLLPEGSHLVLPAPHTFYR